MTERAILTDGERHSEGWRAVKKYAEQRINQLHLTIEGDANEAETAKLRGRIKELRMLLALEKNPPPQ